MEGLLSTGPTQSYLHLEVKTTCTFTQDTILQRPQNGFQTVLLDPYKVVPCSYYQESLGCNSGDWNLMAALTCRTGNPHFPNIREFNSTLHFYNSTCLGSLLQVSPSPLSLSLSLSVPAPSLSSQSRSLSLSVPVSQSQSQFSATSHLCPQSPLGRVEASFVADCAMGKDGIVGEFDSDIEEGVGLQ